MSTSNTLAEMIEKTALYFECGAQEVWLCRHNGCIEYYALQGKLSQSSMMPTFLNKI